MKKHLTALVAITLHSVFTVTAGNLVMHSGSKQVVLMELYTSEGCSSCPPAEAWFSQLKDAPGLWKAFVPVAFHVNYWDNLGWRDKYASPAFTGRQRSYAAGWGSDSVYTPELVTAGKEGKVHAVPENSTNEAGLLTATLNNARELSIHYTPALAGKNWEGHVARLGFDVDTAVRAGENRGHILRHDFIVLGLEAIPLKNDEGKITLASAKAGEKGIAVWITESGKLTPVQATGGWVK